MLEVIQTETDGTLHYDIERELDGAGFILRFIFNSYDQHWFLSVLTDAGEEIAGAQSYRLVNGCYPLNSVRDSNRPAGELYLLPQSDQDPTLKTLGISSILTYLPRADILELRAQL
jgi:hypothetical protein